MRRWVLSTISDLGHGEYAQWFIGHSGSTYYRKSDKEREDIYRKIHDHLLFLDPITIERHGAEVETRILELQGVNQMLRQKNATTSDAVTALQQQIDNLQSMVHTLMQNSSKVMDSNQQTTFVKSMYDSGWLTEAKVDKNSLF